MRTTSNRVLIIKVLVRQIRKMLIMNKYNKKSPFHGMDVVCQTKFRNGWSVITLTHVKYMVSLPCFDYITFGLCLN
jgi:hypothetical protein